MIKELIERIRKSIYAVDVRDAIADSIEGIANEEEKHKKEVDTKVNELVDKYNQVIKTGGDSVLEIVDARVPYNSLKERLDDIEEKSMNIEDIKLGGTDNRTLSIYNNKGEMVGLIDKDNSTINELEVSNLKCDNVLSKQVGVYLYVDCNTGDDGNKGTSTSSKLKTISEAIGRLNNYLEANVRIKITNGTYDETITIDGFMGKGSLYLEMEAGTVVNGYIYVNSCTTSVYIQGKSLTGMATVNHTDGATEAPIRVYNSVYVLVQYIIANGNSTSKYSLVASSGSNMSVKQCIANNSTEAAVMYAEESKGYVIEVDGKNHKKYAIRATAASIVGIRTKLPNSDVGQSDDWHGTGLILGTVDTTESTAPNPPTVVTTTTKTYNITNSKSYRAVDGWKNEVYHGRYNPNNPISYNYTSVFVLDHETMRKDLVNKTIKSVQVTFKRYKEGQGIGQPTTVSIDIYGSTSLGGGNAPTTSYKYATKTGIGKNQTVTITLPNSFIADVLNNNINSIAFYKADGTNYSKFENTMSIKVTYV